MISLTDPKLVEVSVSEELEGENFLKTEDIDFEAIIGTDFVCATVVGVFPRDLLIKLCEERD